VRLIPWLVLATACATALHAQGYTRTVTIRIENVARCDTDIRIVQGGRAVVSRAVILQFDYKRISVEVSDSAPLKVRVEGRQCRISYSVDVPVGKSNTWVLEVGDNPQMFVARSG
jgi:hypothetical protein